MRSGRLFKESLKFKLKILPAGRREWLWVALQIVIFAVLFLSASFYVTSMPGRSFSGPLPTLTEIEVESREQLKNHVATLAGQIGERNIKHYVSLNASVGYIEKNLSDLGFAVAAQQYSVEGKSVKNIEAEIRGAEIPEQIIIVGAHYDSITGSPGVITLAALPRSWNWHAHSSHKLSHGYCASSHSSMRSLPTFRPRIWAAASMRDVRVSAEKTSSP